jgi:hypothetical protein
LNQNKSVQVIKVYEEVILEHVEEIKKIPDEGGLQDKEENVAEFLDYFEKTW